MGIFRLLTSALLIGLLSQVPAFAQGDATPSSTATGNLSDYEGRYDYPEGVLYLASDGARLYAVIDEVKYDLPRRQGDQFSNAVGGELRFTRDAKGRVVSVSEDGRTYARLSVTLPPQTRALLRPRPTNAKFRYRSPSVLDDGIAVAAVSEATITPQIAARLVQGVIDGSYQDVHSILVWRRGKLVLEEYFYGYDRDRIHPMRSLTKSVVSLLAGAASDRRLIDPKAPVMARLGYLAWSNPDPRKQRINMLHLLSHTSGLACSDNDANSPGNNRIYDTNDWVKAVLDLPMTGEPGTVASYCSGGLLAASRALEVATGKPLPSFAQDVLFSPLGISDKQWRWPLTMDRSQRDEFGQIYLRPRDMLKFGILLRDNGRWQNRQILSQEWIQQATSRQSRIDGSDYGLGIWHRYYMVRTAAGPLRIDTIMPSGNGGQKIFWVSALDLIVVFTGGAYNIDSPTNAMMADVLLPALIGPK